MWSIKYEPRYISLAAAALVSLGSGTNYAFSSYATQLADVLHLSSVEINAVGAAGNLLNYLSAPLNGYIIDKKGPKSLLILAAICVFVGYTIVAQPFRQDAIILSLPILMIAMALTGLGSNAGFTAALNTTGKNFPENRGTALGLILACFGLSAFFYSTLNHLLFAGKNFNFLMLMAISTGTSALIGLFFIRVVPYSQLSDHEVVEEYEHIPQDDEEFDGGHDMQDRCIEPTDRSISISSPSLHHRSVPKPNVTEQEVGTTVSVPDIGGFELLRTLDFYMFFTILTFLTGTGIQYINNVGSCAQILYRYNNDDHNPDSATIQRIQSQHVSVLSLFNCTGRIVVGLLSDYCKRRFRIRRIWWLGTSAMFFIIAMLLGYNVETNGFLYVVSANIGFAYGLMFGISPPIVSEWFGLRRFGANWGIMTLAAGFSSQIYNILFGVILDGNRGHHPKQGPNIEWDCKGRECYKTAFLISGITCVIAFIIVFLLLLARITADRKAGRIYM